MNLEKYRAVFLEEASEHLAEISRSLLDLEKDPGNVEAIDLIFRMAHSIKGMAASLSYDSVTELAHRVEDRMQRIREEGGVRGEETALLFRGLEGLESMVGAIGRSEIAPPADPVLLVALLEEPTRSRAPSTPGGPKKKVLSA